MSQPFIRRPARERRELGQQRQGRAAPTRAAGPGLSLLGVRRSTAGSGVLAEPLALAVGCRALAVRIGEIVATSRRIVVTRHLLRLYLVDLGRLLVFARHKRLPSRRPGPGESRLERRVPAAP